MAEHNELGKKGEELAVEYLRGLGYRILETNWRAGKHEVDIIAMDKECLVVAEVKTRTSDHFGEPFLAVTREKQKALIRAANYYVQKKNLDCETRFDILSILVKKEGEKVDHIKDAFYPTLK